MAGLFDTSTVTMRSTAQRVMSDAETIQADLANLLNRLMALEGAWIGDGRTAFSGAEARYADANNRLNSALNEISQLITTNEARYTADDASAQSGLTSSAANFTVPRLLTPPTPPTSTAHTPRRHTMADQIRVTFGALDTAVADISSGVAAQGTRMQDLRAAIAPMVATWQGAAQTAYAASQAKWDTAWSDLTDALTQLQNTTDTANQNYLTGENANTSSWN